MRHKFYIDVNDKMDVMFMAINQEDDIGGRRQASIGTKYVQNPDCTSLLATNCYEESVYGKYENGALMLEPSSREVSMESVEMTYDFPFHDLEITASQYDRSGESVTDNTGFFAGTGTFTSPAYGYFSDVFAAGGIFGTPPRPYTNTHAPPETFTNTHAPPETFTNTHAPPETFTTTHAPPETFTNTHACPETFT